MDVSASELAAHADRRQHDPEAVLLNLSWRRGMRGKRKNAPSRREILRGAQVLGAAVLAPQAFSGCGSDPAGPFQNGVASGDPLPDGVILWTRVTANGDRAGLGQLADRERSRAGGRWSRPEPRETDAERDFTVKVDVRGLEPGRTYYYRFETRGGLVADRADPHRAGRGRPAGSVRRGVLLQPAQGYFHAYRALAGRADLDAVIHLGDYIYEGGHGEFGSVAPARSPTRAAHACGLPRAPRAIQTRSRPAGGPPAAPVHRGVGRP